MVGGVDTTANMLAWSSYVLANHHDIQEKLRGEILNFLARVSEPTYADINTLPYLNGFVKELLRVYSPGKIHTTPILLHLLYLRLFCSHLVIALLK